MWKDFEDLLDYVPFTIEFDISSSYKNHKTIELPSASHSSPQSLNFKLKMIKYFSHLFKSGTNFGKYVFQNVERDILICHL